MSKLVINGYRDFHGMDVNKAFNCEQFASREELIQSMVKSFCVKDEAELTQVVKFTVVETTFTNKELSDMLDSETNLPEVSANIFS